MEVIISESLVCHPSLHHPTTHTSPSLCAPTRRPSATTQHALKREGEDPLCLSPPFKQKTSSDLERPTTLLSCGCMCVHICVCVCFQRPLFFSE